MKNLIPLLATILLLACKSKAQLYLEPVVGFQTDLINSYSFNQVNSAIQLGLKKSKYYELIFQLHASWPVTTLSRDSSFNQNTAFPLYASAGKTMRASEFSIAAGNRIAMSGRNTSNIFSLIAFGGLSYQRITVTYQYDKANYTILNPDKTQKRLGVFASCGIEYMRLLENGRAFIQMSVATPPFGKAINKPASFNFIAPLSINGGYSIPLKRSNHGK